MGLKRLWLIAASTGMVALLAASTSWAQMKVGYLDSEEILAKYKPLQEAEKEVQRFRTELEKEYTERENELKKLQATYDNRKLIASKSWKEETERELARMQQDIQRFLQEIGDPARGKLAKKNQEILAPILNKVNEVVQGVAKDNGYDFVFNTAALAYANEEHDLTQMVLEALEKELEAAEKKKEAASTPGPRR
jgi:outer membrane protein